MREQLDNPVLVITHRYSEGRTQHGIMSFKGLVCNMCRDPQAMCSGMSPTPRGCSIIAFTQQYTRFRSYLVIHSPQAKRVWQQQGN